MKPPPAPFGARKRSTPGPPRPQHFLVHDRFRNLPAQSTPLIGRQQEAAAARRLLLAPNVRLLTLTGPPGIGKTRLALEVATNSLDAFEHGAAFVDLAPITDPMLVVSTIARTLRLRESGVRPLLELLRDYLRERQLLLILDNFEQVVEAAPHVAELLAVCPHLKIVATSRAPLHLTWEHEFPVPPLALPDLRHPTAQDALAECAAVSLFVQRARAVSPEFALSKENARAVAEICVHLDGLPLAIELAAVRVKLSPPQTMLGRLQHRLHLLTAGARDLPPRHRTLRGAIGWSYDLLGTGDKSLFRRLSVFVGGCTPEAAQAACNGKGDPTTDMLESLESLVDKSLLRQEMPHGGVRFRMLETIREYGLEQLAANGEIDSTKRRHTDFFLALAERAEPELRGPEQRAWLDRLETEHDNLRAALEWTKTDQGGAELELRLAGALWQFWDVRGFWREGVEWLEGALARSSGSFTPWRGHALGGAGRLAWRLGDHRRAVGLFEKSLALFRNLGDERGTALVLNFLGTVARRQENYEEAGALYEESLALFRESGDRWGIASVLNNLGAVALHHGEHDRAATLCEESLALFRDLGSKREIAKLLNNLGELARFREDHGRAEALFEESLAALRELGSKEDIAMALHNLGHMAHRRGRYGRAAALFKESLALHWELGTRRGIVECLAGLAGVAGSHGQPAHAARLFGAAEALLATAAGRLDLTERAEYDRNLATVRAALDEQALRSAWAQGRALPLEQAIQQAVSVADAVSATAATEELAGRKPSTVLTHREQQITALIAQGLTNREIAKALVITERTAGTHVQHILNKLGFNSRAQIAAWAVEHGLHTSSPQ